MVRLLFISQTSPLTTFQRNQPRLQQHPSGSTVSTFARQIRLPKLTMRLRRTDCICGEFIVCGHLHLSDNNIRSFIICY